MKDLRLKGFVPTNMTSRKDIDKAILDVNKMKEKVKNEHLSNIRHTFLSR
jgi:hypothetical protein